MRLARGLALQLRERSFIEASHISGGGPLYVVRRHLVPNAMGPLLVGISLTAAYSLLAVNKAELGDPLPEECAALLFPRGLVAHTRTGANGVPSPGKNDGAAMSGAAGGY